MGGSKIDSSRDNGGLVFFGKDVRYGLDKLLASEGQVLGKGTFGSTYKATLEGGDVVAVKRMQSACSFGIGKVEIEKLGGIVHENLLPLRAYYCGEYETLLLTEYMPMGSLSTLLHGEGKGVADKTSLTWEIRSSIAYGVACGLEYLHSQGPNVCHGNIRSSNIFLTNFYDARLSEFGIGQLVSPYSKTNLIAGYCAPEATTAHDVSPKADVYSFGVLLLEMLTGKAPLHAVPYNEGVDLAKWVRLMFQEKPICEVFDHELLRYKDIGEQMVQILQLAICCTFQYPNKRPSMAVVTKRIKEVCRFEK